MPNYYSIQEALVDEFEEKKSRFITYLFPIETEEDFAEELAKIKKEHYRATHHCQAFILNDDSSIQRANDDGEPSGTAGLPMLEVLKQNELTYVGAVCVRYFGGIKLGAGGLIRAYSKGVADAVHKAVIIQNINQQVVHLTLQYTHNDSFNYWLSQTDYPITILDTIYTDVVTYELAVNLEDAEDVEEALINRFSAQIKWENIEERQVDIPVSK